MRVEDTVQQHLKSQEKDQEMPDLSQLTLDQRFPNRPGYGTTGTKVVLWANYFPMIPKGDVKLHRYAVDIIPDPQSKKKRKQLIELLRTEGPLAPMKDDITSDYQANLICRSVIPEEQLQNTVVHKFENEDEPSARATTYTIRLEATGSFTVADLIAYLTSTNANAAYAGKLDVVQALNIVVGQHPKATSSIMSLGANRHFPLEGPSFRSADLGAGLQVLKGYFVSVRAAATRILVNVQVKHAAVYQPGPLPDLMRNYRGGNPPNLQALSKFLVKVRVSTDHLPIKKNRAGQTIPRIKVIFGFADRNDGRGLPHPPKVTVLGANANNVSFFLNDSPPGGSRGGEIGAKSSGRRDAKKDSKKGSQSSAKSDPGSSDSGRYVTVAEYFRDSRLNYYFTKGLTLADLDISL